MLRIRQILVSAGTLAAGAVVLTACGQRGALYLPTEPAAAQRATLPQTLLPGNPKPAEPAARPTAPSSSPTAP